MIARDDLKLMMYRPFVAQILCGLAGLLLLWKLLSSILAIRGIYHIESTVEDDIAMTKKTSKMANMTLQTQLFGEYIPKQLSNAHIKRSMLNLRVVGILFSNQKQDSYVMIRSGVGVEKAYKEGDTLPGGVVIKQISAEGVVVKHNGELESLSLPKNTLLFESPPKPLQ